MSSPSISPPHPTLPHRVYLSAIATLSLVLFGLMWRDPTAQLKLRLIPRTLISSVVPRHPVRYAPDISKVLPNDPDMGIFIGDRWLADLKKACPPHPASQTLLVYVGECAGCINIDLPDYLKRSQANHLNLVFLTSASAEDAKAFANRYKTSVGAVSDQMGELRGRLNAAWMPRSYVIGPEGQLEWLQTTAKPEYSPFSDPTFIAWQKGGTK